MPYTYIWRYKALDMSEGVSASTGVSLTECMEHLDAWVEAFAPAYQGDHDKQHRAAQEWWARHRKRGDRGLTPKNEWPSRLW